MCDMKKDWEVKKLGEILKLEYGKPLPDEKRVINGNFPVYGANGLKGRSNVFYSDKKTIIVGRKGSAGEINLTEEKFWPLDVTYFVTYDERKYDLLFLFHLLSLLNLPKLAKGVKPGINRNEVYNLEANIPPLPEQKRIVSVLDKCFTAIDKAKANAEQNLKNAKELFVNYLQKVLEGEKDWEIKKLGDVCNLKSGTTISTSLERAEGDILYVKVGDMTMQNNDVEINTSSRFVNRDEISKTQIIPNGAVIFPKRGGAIATNKKRKIIKPTIVDLNIMAIIPKDKIDNNYFYYWFQLIDLKSLSNGTSIPQINNYSFDEVYIPFPPLKIQQSIVRQLDSLKTQTKKLETVYNKKISDLEELKKSILQDAFRGKLTAEATIKLLRK